MAIDFPASPTIGQQSNGFVFDGTKWKVSTTSTAPSSISPTPPANPTIGDLWFNSTDGTMYFYYNDGNTSQWVESRAPIVANGYYSPNYIINGGMDIWQRGTSFANPSNVTTFTADRYFHYRSNLVTGQTTSRQSSGLPGIQYCARVQRASGNTSAETLNLLANTIETANAVLLAGKTVTLSFYARAGANFSGSFLAVSTTSGTGVDQNPFSWTGGTTVIGSSATLTTSWQRYTFTGTVPSNSTELYTNFYYTPSGTAGANDYYEITGVQLEEGSAATTFRRNANSIEGELAACQRYYTRYSLPVGAILGTGHCYFNTGAYIGVHYPTEMRSAPAAIDYSTLSYFNVYSGGINRVPTTIGLASGSSSTKTALIGFAGATGFTVGYGAWLESNNAGAYVGFSAEL